MSNDERQTKQPPKRQRSRFVIRNSTFDIALGFARCGPGYTGLGVWRCIAQVDHGGAPAPPIRRSVAELQSERMMCQKGSDNGPLGSRAAAVDQAHLAVSAAGAFRQVVADDPRDLPGGEGVKVQGILDGNDDRGLFALVAMRSGWHQRILSEES